MTPITPQDVNKYITTIRINFENAYKTQTDEEREILIKSWYAILKEYPKEICDKAVIEAIKHTKSKDFAPRIGDIVDNIEKLRTAYEKSDGELWVELTSALHKVSKVMYFGGADYWDNGVRINPIEEANRIYSELSPELQSYVGGISGLMELSRQETLEYEKGRFLKSVETLRTREKIKRETPANIEYLVQGLSAQLQIGDGKK